MVRYIGWTAGILLPGLFCMVFTHYELNVSSLCVVLISPPFLASLAVFPFPFPYLEQLAQHVGVDPDGKVHFDVNGWVPAHADGTLVRREGEGEQRRLLLVCCAVGCMPSGFVYVVLVRHTAGSTRLSFVFLVKPLRSCRFPPAVSSFAPSPRVYRPSTAYRPRWHVTPTTGSSQG